MNTSSVTIGRIDDDITVWVETYDDKEPVIFLHTADGVVSVPLSQAIQIRDVVTEYFTAPDDPEL